MKVDFVKAHCGWDTMTLLATGQVPTHRELEAALKIIDAPVSGGLEVGYLSRGERAQEIRLKVASSTARNWIPMCGGMTQVLGKVLVETDFGRAFVADLSGPRTTVRLVTDSGVIPIEIEAENDRFRRVTTTMDDYAAFLYRRGVSPIVLDGVEALDVSEFLILNLAALERRHPGIDFARRDPGPHLTIINGLLEAYGRHRGLENGVYGMMYDDRPEGPGQFRIYPRFLSADNSAASIPFEFQCGTGTVAVGVALAWYRQLPFAGDQGHVIFEWGSHRSTPDPYGIRTSRLDLRLRDGQVAGARFSHSLVEIIAEGKLTIPGY